MTALAIRSAGSTNAVSQLHGEVTRAMFAPMWPDVPEASRPVTSVTNGVHVPTWIAGELVESVRELPRPGLARPPRRPGAVGRRARDPGRRAVGGARSRCGGISSRSFASGRGTRWMEEHVGIPRVVAAGTLLDPDVADDRLRAPLHRLQAAGARLPRSRAARAHPQRAGPAGADHLRRQVASGRRHRQAPPAARLQARARSAVRRARRVRRRLRPARRALPRAGLRRLAEQPAQAARGERHERHEGGDQRRAASEHRRRLVGRRLHRRERLGDRRRRAGDNPTRSTPRTPPRSTGCSRKKSCRRSTIATGRTSRIAGSRS